MQTHLILSINSEDKPGVIEAVAQVVSAYNGNWLESRFSQLAGLFAGIVRIQLEQSEEQTLSHALNSLTSKGIAVNIHHLPQPADSHTQKKARFHALGPDKPGIVREFTHVFSTSNINIEEINSKISSMPYSGDPLFEADGRIALPPGTDIDTLEEKLTALADTIGIDFKLTEQS